LGQFYLPGGSTGLGRGLCCPSFSSVIVIGCILSSFIMIDIMRRVSVSRRTFGPSSVNVHAWLAATPQLTKCIWTMAVAQHQFYLDRKQFEVYKQLSSYFCTVSVNHIVHMITDIC